MRNEKGQFVKGNSPWHKGKTGIFSDEYRKKLSDAKKGKPNWRKGQTGVYKHTEEWKKAQSERLTGHTLSEETRKKISEGRLGEKHWNWKGGTSKGPSRLSNYSYKKFRFSILKRDGKCVTCGSIERLEVDHIKPYAFFPELRLEPTNCRVLCHPCHKETETYGKNKYKELQYA